MNFKNRIRKLENRLLHNGLLFSDLLKDNYKYKGKPFDSWSEMCNVLQLQDIPPYTTDAEDIILMQKGLLSHFSNEAISLRKKAGQQMKENM